MKNKLVVTASRRGIKVIQLIEEALEQAGSKHGAAQLLGVQDSTITYHLRKSGLVVHTQRLSKAIVMQGDRK